MKYLAALLAAVTAVLPISTAALTVCALPQQTVLKADAAGTVKLSGDTLTLSGAFTKEQLDAYRDNNAVTRVVAASDAVLPESCVELFDVDDTGTVDIPPSIYYWQNLVSVDLSAADASQVTDMRYMFCGCRALQSVDLSGLDTSNVREMSRMFGNCTALTSVDFSGISTPQLTDMAWMFQNCSALTSIDLSSFDTSNVKDMGALFADCSELTSLDLSNFDTANAEDMGGMFWGCEKLTAIDPSGFHTKNARI